MMPMEPSPQPYTKTPEFKKRLHRVVAVNICIFLAYTFLPIFYFSAIPTMAWLSSISPIFSLIPSPFLIHFLIILGIALVSKIKGDAQTAKIYFAVIRRLFVTIALILVIGLGLCFLLISGYR